MRNNKELIKDYGRPIKNSKKELYQLEDGEYKVNISKIWPKKQITSPDRFCRYLTTVLRKEMRSLLTTSKSEAEQFIRLVNFTKESLNSINEPKEFFLFLSDLNNTQTLMDFLFKDKAALLDYFNKDIVDIALDMEEEHFEKSNEEIAYENVCTQLWFLKTDQVKVVDSNLLELELPVEFETVDIFVNKNLDFKLQDPNLGFLVKLNSNGKHYVTNLNVSRDEFNKLFDEAYKKELSKLMEPSIKEQSKKLRNTNNPGIREGIDYLHGISVNEEDIIKRFGFCGQFGNYLSQNERRVLLSKLYVAVNDLAIAMDCSPENLSLPLNDGTPLGISLAARGSGKASGHFEDKEYVINLTKKTLLEENCGILAHEFGHAFDYWLGNRLTGQNKFLSEMIYSYPNLLPEFTSIIDFITLPDTAFSLSAVSIDIREGRRKTYWNLTKEKFARAFNSCIIEILKQKGFRNDFLAYNFNDKIESKDKGVISPNPKGKELQELTLMFKTLFKVLLNKGYLEKLNENLMFKKPQFPEKEIMEFKRARQMNFFN